MTRFDGRFKRSTRFPRHLRATRHRFSRYNRAFYHGSRRYLDICFPYSRRNDGRGRGEGESSRLLDVESAAIDCERAFFLSTFSAPWSKRAGSVKGFKFNYATRPARVEINFTEQAPLLLSLVTNSGGQRSFRF
mgnify:CR=1 FL=1